MKTTTRYDRRVLYKYFYDYGDLLSSPYGADLNWSLPRGKKPGAWQRATGDLEMCVNGLHVGIGPAGLRSHMNRTWNVRIFRVEVETRDLLTSAIRTKICVRAVRLLTEVEWGTREWKRIMEGR